MPSFAMDTLNDVMVVEPGLASGGQIYVNAYLRTILGRRTSGRILNVGAGSASTKFQYARILNNTEYHTLEPTGDTKPTYVADAQRMDSVPSEYYDWVISLAVLEHLPDMHAAAAEIARVTKPGGYIYISLPLHNDIHFDHGYWDYWRATPFGMQVLFNSYFQIHEIEFWGDSVCDPVAISIIARKTPPEVRTWVTRFVEIDGGLTSCHSFVNGSLPFQASMNIWKLSVSFEDYVSHVGVARRQHFLEAGANIPCLQMDQHLRAQLAVKEGSIAITNDSAVFLPIT